LFLRIESEETYASSAYLDTIAPLHQIIFVRLTINLDDELYAMARSHAIATKTSISKAVGDLLRRRTKSSPSEAISGRHQHSGFPVTEGKGHLLTAMEIQKAMDDDLGRPTEILRRSPIEIENLP